MSLFQATILLGFILIFLGALFQWKPFIEGYWLRSRTFDVLAFGTASAFFLWKVSNLGEADFGQYRNWLFLFFGLIAIGAMFRVKDFLGIRGIAIIILLLSRMLLDAAFMEDAAIRLYMVSFVYLLIIFALWVGVQPFRIRNLVQYLNDHSTVKKYLSYGLFTYGGALVSIAFIY